MVMQQAFNIMSMLLMARFMLNDISHLVDSQLNASASDSGYGEPPTPRQLRYIAVLCQRLGMKRPLEEEVKTRGEAGRLIRELEAEEKHRRRLRGGS